MTSSAHLLRHQLRYEQRTYWRNPAAVFFTIGLPVVMLLIFTSLNSKDHLPHGQTYGEYFTPGMVVFGVLNASYGNLATKLVLRRDGGLLKRTRSTPLPMTVYLAGMLLNALLTAVVVCISVLLAGRLVLNVPLPSHALRFAAVLALGALSFAGLGLALSTVIPNPGASDPMVYGTLMPILFISGVFDQVPTGSTLSTISSIFPVSHLLTAATGAPTSHLPRDLAVVLAGGVVGLVIAAKRFRWEAR